jgi:hypothetical protein
VDFVTVFVTNLLAKLANKFFRKRSDLAAAATPKPRHPSPIRSRRFAKRKNFPDCAAR